MSTVDIVEYSRNLLRSLPGAGRDVRSVASLLQRCTARTLRDEEVICNEGDPGDAMFFLVSGAIRVERKSGDEGRTLSRMRPPALLGHMSLIDNSPRSGALVAEGPTGVLVLERPVWNRLVGDNTPEAAALRRIVMASLSVQLCRTTNLLNNLLPDNDASSQRGVEKSALHSLAGAVAGWDLDTSEVERVEFVKADVPRRQTRH